MEPKGQISIFQSDNILLSDSNYYKYIFKRTEKIVCCVFYIIEHTDKGQNEPVALSVREAAKRALDVALETLPRRWHLAYGELYAFLRALIALESNLHVAAASSLITDEIVEVLTLEIGTVMRGLRQYLVAEKSHAPDISAMGGTEALELGYRMAPPPERETRIRSGGANSTTARAAERASLDAGRRREPSRFGAGAFSIGQNSKGQSIGQHIGRRIAIKDILSLNKRTTVKDIAKKLTEYSEKSIQREISAMIRQGLVIKEGEKRWRSYSLAPGV